MFLSSNILTLLTIGGGLLSVGAQVQQGRREAELFEFNASVLRQQATLIQAKAKLDIDPFGGYYPTPGPDLPPIPKEFPGETIDGEKVTKKVITGQGRGKVGIISEDPFDSYYPTPGYELPPGLENNVVPEFSTFGVFASALAFIGSIIFYRRRHNK